jgi:peptidoglycan hydrolase-like protein with peptidoglycan-binding domain
MPLNISLTQHSRDPQTEVSVKTVQRRLQARGYYIGKYGVDGIFGQDCDTATRRFQRMNGLTPDGVVGPLTMSKLNVSTSAPAPSAPPKTSTAFADKAYRLVTQGIDGTRPAYVFGAEANLTDPSPDRIDCSELVQWAVYQITHDSWVDGSRYQYAACRHISVAEAIKTKGALLFVTGSGTPNGIHHVAVSMGNGMTAEARSKYTTPQVGSWSAHDRFQYGALIPTLRY